MWRGRFQLLSDGRPVAVWDSAMWRTGGAFEVEGHRFEVRSNTWGTRYRMVDEHGTAVAVADKVGRKHWSVEADGRAYEFRRASIWRSEQELLADGRRVGSVRRTSAWTGAVAADLPGLPLPVQIFVVGVQIAQWQAQQAAAAGA